MGGKYKPGWALRRSVMTMALVLSTLPASAFSSDWDHDHSGAGHMLVSAMLRDEGNGPTYLPHPAIDMVSDLPSYRHDSKKRAGPPQNIARMAPRLLHQARALRRLDSTMVVKHWYAVASAGSGALAFVAGQSAKVQGLYVQKRAKLRGGQLGLARNVGAAQLTVGYLLTNPDRNPLTPYYTGRYRQNLAALSLTLRK